MASSIFESITFSISRVLEAMFDRVEYWLARRAARPAAGRRAALRAIGPRDSRPDRTAGVFGRQLS
ncbi:MAG: hypothetical protein JWM21_3576 [Acidobacteria bacterium]|nr:hypothetical protein [Acidobacteriota bacterium]